MANNRLPHLPSNRLGEYERHAEFAALLETQPVPENLERIAATAGRQQPEGHSRIPVAPSTPLPASHPGPAEWQGFSPVDLNAMQGYGQWLEETPARPTLGGQALPLSAPLVDLPSQNRTVQGHTQDNALSSHLLLSLEERKARVSRLLSEELKEHGRLIGRQFLKDDPAWNLRAPQEQGRLVDEEWMRRAKRLEIAFASNHDIVIEGLNTDRDSVTGLVTRLVAMVAGLARGTASGAAGTISHRNLRPESEKEVQDMESTVGVLRGWTTEWREQLGRRMRSTSASAGREVPSSNLQQRPSDEALQNLNPGQYQPPPLLPAQQPYMPPADRQPPGSPPAEDVSYERLLEDGVDTEFGF